MSPLNTASCEMIKSRFSQDKARKAQLLLSRKVLLRDTYSPIRIVAGVDVAYMKGVDQDIGVGVVVALSYPSLRLIDCVVYIAKVCIPYIPGLLAFREMAVLGPALIRLNSLYSVDVYVVDGHGIAHPRRLGIASHIGVVMDRASIGVAKKRLYGREITIADRRVLVDDNGKVIAVVLESGRRSRIYVSPGNKITPFTAARLISSMLRKGRRLPEPTRVADRISKEIRRWLNETTPYLGYLRCSDSRFPGIS